MKKRLTIRLFILLALMSIGIKNAYTQQNNISYLHTTRLSLGVSAGHYGFDPAIGFEFTTPCIIKNRLSFRLKGNLSWLEHYKAFTNNWARFGTYWAGVVYNTKVIDRARVYFELGTFTIAPDNKFSEKQFVQGYYSLVGTELFIANENNYKLCYYFSGGFGQIHAHAEKLEGSPRYGNGSIFSNGFRLYF